MTGGETMVRSALITVLGFLLWKGGDGAPSGREDWGYVQVRPGAHMFWWLYYANPGPARNQNQTQSLPLIMWLQGGPGGSSTGFGNFEEIGPLDRDLNPRTSSWVQASHLLLVDNPVGSGFSYTEDLHGLAANVSTVASDMMELLAHFFRGRSQLQNVPFYIFSESYGGKMAAVISLELTKAVTEGRIRCSFQGVALGDSWISPLDSVLTWAPFLYSTSLLDDSGLEEVSAAAEEVRRAVEARRFVKATELWSVTETVVEQNTNGVNFYNILSPDQEAQRASSGGDDFISLQTRRHLHRLNSQSLSQLMNGPIRKKLGIIPHNVTWGGQSACVFSAMVEDFMKPVVEVVDQLLTSGLSVCVYNGQLDLIVDTVGQELWVKRLQWAGLPAFNKLRWTPVDDPASPGLTGAFFKNYKNFSFYWILRAGHMIPSDQGPMALQMMRMVTQQV